MPPPRQHSAGGQTRFQIRLRRQTLCSFRSFSSRQKGLLFPDRPQGTLGGWLLLSEFQNMHQGSAQWMPRAVSKCCASFSPSANLRKRWQRLGNRPDLLQAGGQQTCRRSKTNQKAAESRSAECPPPLPPFLIGNKS